MFRLARLLRVRGLQESVAEASAALAAAQAREARGVSVARRERLQVVQLPGRTGELAFAASVAARSASSHLFSESLTLVAQADDAAEEAAHAAAAARRRVLALERLAVRHDTAATAEELRVEQAAIDEVAGRSSAIDDVAGRSSAIDLDACSECDTTQPSLTTQPPTPTPTPEGHSRANRPENAPRDDDSRANGPKEDPTP